MSALAGYIIKQVERTTQSAKRLRVIMVLMFIIAGAGLVLLAQAAPRTIEYQQQFVAATPSVVCPGEAFTYPVQLKVEQVDAVAMITEGWCRAADGICPKGFQNPPYYINLMNILEVSTTATRTVPVGLPPGDWQFTHCNTTLSTLPPGITCYAVNVTVKDCEVKQ